MILAGEATCILKTLKRLLFFIGVVPLTWFLEMAMSETARYVFMYVYTYACIRFSLYVCMHACMFACTHVRCAHVCMYVCMRVWMYACTHVYIYAYLPGFLLSYRSFMCKL